MYTVVEFTGVENNRTITREEYPDFYFDLQRAVLISLKDSGKLNLIQFREAEAILKSQKSKEIRNMANNGSRS